MAHAKSSPLSLLLRVVTVTIVVQLNCLPSLHRDLGRSVLKNRTRSLPPRTSSQQALAQRRSGAKYVASSAPSHIRMPRVGALESPQRSKWWHSDMRCGQDKRKSAASPHQSEPRVCSLSVFLFLNKVTSSSAQLKKKHPKPMPVLAVSKVRKPEQRETRLKSHTFLLLLELEVYF